MGHPRHMFHSSHWTSLSVCSLSSTGTRWLFYLAPWSDFTLMPTTNELGMMSELKIVTFAIEIRIITMWNFRLAQWQEVWQGKSLINNPRQARSAVMQRICFAIKRTIQWYHIFGNVMLDMSNIKPNTGMLLTWTPCANRNRDRQAWVPFCESRLYR